MNKGEAEQRIKKLRDIINYHRYLYHVLDRQEISDSALDSLKKELFDLEREFPEFIVSDSPTQRIGGKPLEKFKKVKHSKPMLSFNDGFSEEDIKNWLERALKFLDKKESSQIDYFSELKIDGLAVELIYEKGKLKTASTRGDGKIGEEITQNIKTIEAVPLKLREKEKVLGELEKGGFASNIIEAIKKNGFKERIIVRGEVFISKKEFERVNKERRKKEESVYANPRNLAAGSIRQLDSKIAASRNLDFFAYDLLNDFGSGTHEEKHKILRAFGFKTNIHNKYCRDLKEVFDFYHYSQNLREKLYYEIDGLVIIINQNKIFEKLGRVGKAPRGAIAYKFPAKQAVTIVEDIKIQIGRTGALTPVAYLKPVQIGGAVVSRATLHNEDEIKRLGLKIGDSVIVSRAGDVIPDIVKVLPKLRGGGEKEFKMPLECPVCGGKIKRKSGEAVYYCSNPNCFAVQRKYFEHFVSKNAFDIEGLGPKIIDRLIDESLISDPADIFYLKERNLVFLERFGEKSAKNLVASVKEKKEITFPRFIYALGIKNIGEETAILLAKKFANLENLQKAKIEELENIKDIGPIAAKSIFDWFSRRKNIEFLKKLKRAGIRIGNRESGIKNKKLRGKVFVLSGILRTMNREEAKKRIRELGGKISESVSKKTNFLVIGENPGSKYSQAKKLNIKIISEEDFLKIVGFL